MPQFLQVIKYIMLELWQLTFFMLWNALPLAVELMWPVRLIKGQYLHVLLRLHGFFSILLLESSDVLVEARTRKSAKFLFRL